jgi:crotonobetainyl-CoA:carnitine CoA-transferase CaiB-like acyl-CoA transferase
MTNVIAGPTAGKLLSDLGADVVKLESLDGDISRPGGSAYFYHLNANKRSVSVNTRAPEGREIAQRLAAQADILLANMRPGASDRMGIGADVIRRLNPRIIESHVTAYGWTGPYAHRPGLDPLAQALMGLQRAQGGPENPPVFLGRLAPTDFTAGALGALGAVLALYARERTGKPQRADTNLLNAGILLSSEDFMRYEGKPPRRLADKGQHGLDALHRLYETSQGWIYVVAETQEAWLALCKALGCAHLASDPRFASKPQRRQNDAALAQELARTFKERPAEEWVHRLSEARVPCAPAIAGYDDGFFSDPQAIANDMIAAHQHPTLGQMKLSRHLIKFGDTAEVVGLPTPLLGQHTREVLQELGYPPGQIEELYAKGVVKTEESSE